MKNNQGFSVIVIVIIIAILAAGGYAMWKNQTVTPPSALPEGEGTSTSPLGGGSEGVEGWKTYRNDKYGFEFKYPGSFELVDGFGEVYPGVGFFSVSIENKSVLEKPRLVFSINGMPMFMDESQLVYKVIRNQNGLVAVTGEESVAGYIIQPDGGLAGDPAKNHLQFISAYIKINDINYRWGASFVRGGNDYKNIFKQILSTFRFTK